MFAIYNALSFLTVWLLLVPWHFILIFLGRFSWNELLQRLGRNQLPERTMGTRILIHACSIGEVAAINPLARSLSEFMGDVEIVITAGNRDGYDAARRFRKHLSNVVHVSYIPWDTRGIVHGWLRCLKPDIVAVVEAELWPILFISCKQLGIPLCIVNGRIPHRDIHRYRMARSLFEKVLSSVAFFFVQNESEGKHFVSIGAEPSRVQVIGNLKFDVPSTHTPSELRSDRIRDVGPLIVAGSTHDPEERFILKAFQNLRKSFPRLRLVLAPRKPARSPAIRRITQNLRLNVQLWSDRRNQNWDILILDELGVLPLLYEHADIAIVGGSFSNNGGHNIIEPAVFGRAIVIGPNTEHVQDLMNEFEMMGAIQKLNQPQELEQALRELLASPQRRVELGERAYSVVHSHKGVASLYAKHIMQLIPLHSNGILTHEVIESVSHK